MPFAHVQPCHSAGQAYQEVGAMSLKAALTATSALHRPVLGPQTRPSLCSGVFSLTLAHLSEEGKEPLTESASQF